MNADRVHHWSEFCEYFPKTRNKSSHLRRRRRRQAQRNNYKASLETDSTEDVTVNDVDLETLSAPSYNGFIPLLEQNDDLNLTDMPFQPDPDVPTFMEQLPRAENVQEEMTHMPATSNMSADFMNWPSEDFSPVHFPNMRIVSEGELNQMLKSWGMKTTDELLNE